MFLLLSEGTQKRFAPIMIDRILTNLGNCRRRKFVDRFSTGNFTQASVLQLYILTHPIFFSTPQNGYTETKLRIPASIPRVT